MFLIFIGSVITHLLFLMLLICILHLLVSLSPFLPSPVSLSRHFIDIFKGPDFDFIFSVIYRFSIVLISALSFFQNVFQRFCFAFVMFLSFKNLNCTVTMHCVSNPVISSLLIPTFGLISISTWNSGPSLSFTWNPIALTIRHHSFFFFFFFLFL